MGKIRYLLAIFLLFFSARSLALFMPAGGVPTDTDRPVATDSEGC